MVIGVLVSGAWASRGPVWAEENVLRWVFDDNCV